MKRSALAFVASLLLMGVFATPVLAITTVVDQKMEVTATNFGPGPVTFAQTFTSGYSRPLSGVDLYLKSSSSIVVSVSIRPLDPITKYPTNTSYSTGSATVKAEGWYHFNTPVDISTGAQYAIVFTLPASAGLKGATTHQYAGGSALVKNTNWGPFYNADTDFAFRTYVALPDPTPTPKPTPSPSPTPTPPAMATLNPTPTGAPTVAPASTATSTASPTPVAADATDTSAPGASLPSDSGSSSSDTGLPILLIGGVILLALAAGVGVVGFLLWRRGSKVGPPAAGTPPAA